MKCFVLAAVALMGAALLGTDQAGACGCGCCAKQAAPANPVTADVTFGENLMRT